MDAFFRYMRIEILIMFCVDGFVAEIRRIYKLPRTFQPSVIFTSTQNVRSSSYTQRHIRELYFAVKMLLKLAIMEKDLHVTG